MAAAAHAPPDQHLSGPPAPQTPAAARRPPAWYEEACSPQACSAPAAPQPSPAGTSNTHAAPIAAPDEIRLPRPAPRPAEPCGVRCLRSSSPAHATSGLPVNRRPLRPKAACNKPSQFKLFVLEVARAPKRHPGRRPRSAREMKFLVAMVPSLAAYGNSNSYFCNPYMNEVSNVSVGTHGQWPHACESLLPAAAHSHASECGAIRESCRADATATLIAPQA